jgi:hypothetical protein
MHDAQVHFHSLSFVPEGAGVLVGRPDTESYAVFPPDGADLLQHMVNGMTPTEAAEWYETTYRESIDVAEFLATLEDLGFTRAAGEQQATEPPVRWQRLARALYSRTAFACYVGLVAAWMVTVSRHPEIAPNPRRVFFTSSLLIAQVTIVASQIGFLFMHEAAHVLAGKRIGLRSSLGIGQRMYAVVLETRMNGLLSVPRRQRYLPFLSGIMVDVLLICGLGLLAAATRGSDGSMPLIGRFALASGFPIVIRIIWQFLLFQRTDLYYVFCTMLRCYDLHAAARTLVRNRFWRALGKEERLVDEGNWTDRDRQIAWWYAPFAAIGLAILTIIMIMIVIPLATIFAHLLWQGLSGDFGLRFWDALGSLLLNSAQILAFVYPTIRNYVRSRRVRSAASAPNLLGVS